MPIRNVSSAAFVLISLTLAVPAHAQDSRNGMVLVAPNGEIMRDIPEAGSVRTTVDVEGRILLLNDWNEVVGIQMTRQQYRRDYGQSPMRAQRQRQQPQYDTGRAYPGQFPSEREDLRDRSFGDNEYGYRDDGYEGRYDDRYDNQSDSFPDAPSYNRDKPRASIERRDLNPATSSVLDRSVDEPTRPSINNPVNSGSSSSKLSTAQVTALQVFLDRNGMSPGVIDGRMGSNVEKALNAWREASGEKLDPADTAAIVERLTSGDGLAFTTYEISSADAAGPYVASIPSDYSEKAKLERLAFTSTLEMLAEKFHMDEGYLKALNSDADFTRPGTIIKVVAPGAKLKGKVARIIADKGTKQVRGYDANGKLLVAYPATIGSSDTPSPSGTVRIERIAHNPGYTYNPKINFQQGTNTKVLDIPPGPNGPVGATWIALSKPTYGIHGTPEPSKIGKTASHGCVRLTNWDANELAGMVEPGVIVSFID